MDYGICLPNFPDGASREGIEAAADAAERLAWSTVWTTDHVLVEAASAAEYGRIYDAILTLAWVGARFATVKLATSIIVVPQRNAVVLAKELASLDALTGGRVIAGVGVGWNETEFANLGVGDRFRVRGAYLDETIALWRHLWSGSRDPFHGRFHTIDDFVFGPLPDQRDRLPIIVGGESDAALRRAGAVADGFHSSSTGPEEYGPLADKVRAAASAAGRTPQLSARVNVRLGETAGSRYAMRGTPEDVAAEVRAFATVGVTHLALAFGETSPEGVSEAAERFAREVVPLV
ncbi:MAG TPA: TIGR03619 family F420-dependent LLM class oxidoreductase [Candidatus Limnocylindrales bacterium]